VLEGEGSGAQRAYTATLLPSDSGLPSAAGCLVKVPAKQVCIDVEKSGITPPPPGAPPGAPAQRYLCYKVKCPRNEYQLPVQDQFGSRSVLVKKPGLLCAPIVTTTTTTSTTTTSLPSNLRCCDESPGCFDGDETFITNLCPSIGGTVAPAGQACDGTTGACSTTGATGPLCCSCAQLQFCMEGPIVPFGDLCSQVGCTPIVGQVCDDVTHACRLP
jgi:hypothetical protein